MNWTTASMKDTQRYKRKKRKKTREQQGHKDIPPETQLGELAVPWGGVVLAVPDLP